MQPSILEQGFDLMLFGMGTVFVFLTLLVFATRIMSWAVNRFFPEPEPIMAASPAQPSPGSTAAVDPKVLAVIQEAIHQHRAKHMP